MEDLKQNKIQDKLKQIQEYQNILARAQELQKALVDYNNMK